MVLPSSPLSDMPAAAAAPAATAVATVQEVRDVQGQLAARCSLLHEVPHGPMSAFNATGLPSMEGTYQFGLPHGAQRMYDDDRKLMPLVLSRRIKDGN